MSTEPKVTYNTWSLTFGEWPPFYSRSLSEALDYLRDEIVAQSGDFDDLYSYAGRTPEASLKIERCYMTDDEFAKLGDWEP